MNLQSYQRQIDDWAQQFEKPYWRPLSQFARLAEEVGEVGRLLNHMHGDKLKKPDEARQNLPDELADILFNIMCMANAEGKNLDEAMQGAIRKASGRDSVRFERKGAK